MKALSIAPEYALAIMLKEKTVECRTWKTDYRGDILICSSADKIPGTIPGHALCVAEIVDIVPFTEEHLYGALMYDLPEKACYAWILGNIRIIKPFPVKGKLSLWNCEQPVEYLNLRSRQEADEAADQYFKPLIYLKLPTRK